MNDTSTEDRLVDLRGIATLLGVSKYTPQQWRERGQLPDPDMPDFPDKPLWRTSTVVDWAKDTRRWPPGKAARGPRRRKPPAE